MGIRYVRLNIRGSKRRIITKFTCNSCMSQNIIRLGVCARRRRLLPIQYALVSRIIHVVEGVKDVLTVEEVIDVTSVEENRSVLSLDIS